MPERNSGPTSNLTALVVTALVSASLAYLACSIRALNVRERDADTDMSRRVETLENNRSTSRARYWSLLVAVVGSLIVVAATQVHISFH